VLRAGARIAGPALILDDLTTYVIEPGWNAMLDAAGCLRACRTSDDCAPSRAEQPQIVRLELFEHRLAGIAEEMGRMLERTAVSVNVKERLDFSCAVFDAEGELLVNAPHIPVHLGALGMCVRSVREALELQRGDVALTNHPAFGGSHLPDLTVIAPVFGAERLVGHVACRAHHAEIGGTRPGSMPPEATTLAEEGVVIAPMHVVRRGRPCFEAVERLLRDAPFPSRAIGDNLADIRAAIAALHRGDGRLRGLLAEHGEAEVRRQMKAIKDRGEGSVRAALNALDDGRYEATEHLDDGSPIRVSIGVAGDRARIDFTGSAAVHAGNLNATPAIVRSAVIYVLRLLAGRRLFLNEGMMRAVDVSIPTGMLNPDFPPDAAAAPAVVGGNVETSQRIVDTLLKAMRTCACSQGTMNNLLLGTDAWGYYETVGGGSGAGPHFDGADAVHTHMTNTRITDPEILEHRYPVRLDRFAVRGGSGGAGARCGGDGVVREMTFLEAMELSILSQHRSAGPYGAMGGAPGEPGRQRLLHASGEAVELRAIDGCRVSAGDRLVLETPGGGGWGKAEKPESRNAET
jgi:5-oxoprolinase (ATP-hydrolysing)